MSDLAREIYRDQALQSGSPARLVHRLMQKILTALDSAAKAAERGKTEERHAHVSKVCRVLTGFQQALDVENGGQIAENLSSLYRFAIKRLVEFEIRNDPKIAHEVVIILMPLAAAWHKIAEPLEVVGEGRAQPISNGRASGRGSEAGERDKAVRLESPRVSFSI